MYWLVYWHPKDFCCFFIPLCEFRATSSGPKFSGCSKNCMCSLIFIKSMHSYPRVLSKEALPSTLMFLKISLCKLRISTLKKMGTGGERVKALSRDALSL